MRFRAPLIASVVAMVVAVGCLSAPDDSESGGERQPAPATSGDSCRDTEGADTPEEFACDIQAAKAVAESYWAAQFRKSGARFEPVRQLIPYQREGEITCGDEPLPRNNAVYCSAGDFIAYDVNWAFGAFRQVGDAFLYYLLGHEYAHGIQARLGIRKRLTIQQELQADCMAGAFLGDSARGGSLEVQKGDTDELARGLQAVGDAPGQPWFAEGAHGSPEQRTQAFASGFNESLAPCDL